MGAAHAYDYGYGYAYDQIPAPREQVRKLRKVRKLRRVAPVFVLSGEKAHKLSILNVFTLMIIFAGCLGMLLANASAGESKVTISRLNNDIKGLNERIDTLSSEVDVSLNLAEVEDIAINRLGMDKPKPYQIIHIEVPKQSYAVSNYAVEEELSLSSGLSLLSFDRLFAWN